ncbi:MAG: hypothetical protein J5789_06440 [Oscillospiraceae bacterium]|nr:hypothetical protein [Oscillospiraceae bacterium]
MKGDKFMKAVLFTLLCVVACYLVFSATRFSGDGFTTYKAVRFEVGDGITTSGFLVRSEQILKAGAGDIIVPTRRDGEKVGRGQTVAVAYRNEAAKELQDRIDTLEEEISQMKYAYSFSGAELDSAALDSDILELMNQVTTAAARREYPLADEAAESMKPLLLRRYINSADAEAIQDRIREAQGRLDALRAEAGAEAGVVTAPVSGFFSGVADGYEYELTPAFLETATVSALKKYEGLTRRETGALGKLVTSPKWYFAALVPSQNLKTLEPGDRIDVNFAYDFYGTVRMKVERISPSEADICILVLSSESYIQEAVSARTETADLIFEDRSGLRVPKTAIYVDEEGRSGVYVLEGAEAAWKPINIIYDNGDSFIVELDKSSTKNLWPDDEIILTTEEIFNGKVMVK